MPSELRVIVDKLQELYISANGWLTHVARFLLGFGLGIDLECALCWIEGGVI